MWGYIKRIWSAVKAARKTSFRKRLVAMLAAIVLVVTTVGMVRPARTASSEDAAVQQTAGDTVQAEAGENADQTTGVVQTAAEENADTAAQTMPAGTFQAQTATSVQAGDDTAKSVVTNAEVSYDADTFQSGSSFSMKFIDKQSGDTTVSAQAESDQALIDEALVSKGEQTAACYPYALTFLDADGNETEPAAAVNVKLTFAALPKTNANAQWAVFHITVVNGQYVAENLADSANEANRPLVTQNENGALTDVSFTAERFSDYVIAEVEAIPTATPVPTATTAPTATAVPTATPTLTAAPTATAAASAKEAESAATSPSEKSSEADSEAASSAKAGTASSADSNAAESSKTTVTPIASANRTASSDAATATPTKSAKGAASSDAATATPTGSANGAASSDAATATPTKSASSTDSSITPTPTVATTSPARVMRRAAAAEKIQDITENLTNATLTIDGQKVDGTTKWSVKEGQEYDLTLHFEETSSKQFPDDDTWMTYKIPDGLTVDDMNTTFDMVINKETTNEKTIKGNTLVIDKKSGLIKLKWNMSDRNFNALTNANDAYIDVNIKGSFGSDKKQIRFSETVIRDIDVDTTHNASVSKRGYYDQNDGKIYYTVTVNSSGTSKNIVVKDTITGTALTYNNDVYQQSTKGATATVSKEENGFTATIPSMSNGETVTFTYTASVDLSKIKKSGSATEVEAGNGVTITADDDHNPDDNSASNTVSNISYSGLSKNAKGVGNTYTEDGKTYKNVTWNIKANEDRKTNITYISDSIDANSQSIMTYSGEGLTIIVTKADGKQQTRNVKWTDSSIKKTDTGWTYMPPATDDKASYDVTYTTKVNITGLNADKTVQNHASTDHNSSSGNASVGPDAKDRLSASKTATKVTEDEVEWTITINIPKTGYDKLVVTDTLPHTEPWVDTNGDGNNDKQMDWYDTFGKIISVSGLDDSEDYVLDSTSNPKQFTMTFYKDKSHMKTGVNENTTNRTITIRYATNNNKDWVQYISAGNRQDLAGHNNTALIETPNIQTSVYGTAYPSAKTVKKTGKLYRTYKDSGGTTWQVIQYELVLSGASEDDQILTDTFDTEHLSYVDANDLEQMRKDGEPSDASHATVATIYGGGQYDQQQSPTAIDAKVTSSGIQFNTGTLPRKSDGTLYDFYRIKYFLKSQVPVLDQLAFNNKGTTTFSNAVKWETAGSKADITYTFKPVEKTGNYDNLPKSASYTIKVNPSKIEMNGGQNMTLTDTFTHQTIDYSTIKITATSKEIDKSGAISYKDRSGDVSYEVDATAGKLTFTIPDSTSVVITYDAKPSGASDTTFQMTNTAELLTYKDDSNHEVKMDASSGGGGTTTGLRLLKYEKGNMATKLSGAVFQLFDADGKELKYDTGDMSGQDITFTTGSDGYVDINPSKSTGYSAGLEKGKKYILREITAPEGYQVTEDIPFTILTDGSSDLSQNLYANGSTITVADKKITNVSVTLKKVDSGNTTKTLQGAVFDLYGSDYVDSNGTVNTSATAISTGLTTGTDGTVELGTLKSGTYYLVETTAPGGYVAEDKPIKLTVTDEKVTVVQGTATSSSDITDGTAGQTATVTVTDSAGYVLPSTGGIGTVPFYVIGGILAIGAVVALVVRAKMKDR